MVIFCCSLDAQLVLSHHKPQQKLESSSQSEAGSVLSLDGAPANKSTFPSSAVEQKHDVKSASSSSQPLHTQVHETSGKGDATVAASGSFVRHDQPPLKYFWEETFAEGGKENVKPNDCKTQ